MSDSDKSGFEAIIYPIFKEVFIFKDAILDAVCKTPQHCYFHYNLYQMCAARDGPNDPYCRYLRRVLSDSCSVSWDGNSPIVSNDFIKKTKTFANKVTEERFDRVKYSFLRIRARKAKENLTRRELLREKHKFDPDWCSVLSHYLRMAAPECPDYKRFKGWWDQDCTNEKKAA